MKLLRKFFYSLFSRAPETTLLISIYEFPQPRGVGIFEIRLGKAIIFCMDYDFKNSTIEDIKKKIDSEGVNLRDLKFDQIKFNNIGQFAASQMTEWIKG